MWKVAIIESERGWGRSVIEIRDFYSYDSAKNFQNNFNIKSGTTYPVPDYYIQAEEPYYVE